MKKKSVLQLNIRTDKDKQKAIKAVSTLHGIDSISVDKYRTQITVIGEVDPIEVVNKLRKQWQTNIVTIKTATEEKEKEGKSTQCGSGDDNKSLLPVELLYPPWCIAYPAANYYHPPGQENPSVCSIC